MTRDEYNTWWLAQPDDLAELPEPTRTLAAHVLALQERIDALPEYEDANGGPFRCCCAYDHPDDVCMIHAPKPPGAHTKEDDRG